MLILYTMKNIYPLSLLLSIVLYPGCDVTYLARDNYDYTTTLPTHAPLTVYAAPKYSRLSFSIDDGGPVVLDGLRNGCGGVRRSWFRVTIDAASATVHARRLVDNRTWKQQMGRLDTSRSSYELRLDMLHTYPCAKEVMVILNMCYIITGEELWNSMALTISKLKTIYRTSMSSLCL